MITVIKRKHCITVKGHAGYAEVGRDIVCAAVSALTYNLQESTAGEDIIFLKYRRVRRPRRTAINRNN